MFPKTQPSFFVTLSVSTVLAYIWKHRHFGTIHKISTDSCQMGSQNLEGKLTCGCNSNQEPNCYWYVLSTEKYFFFTIKCHRIYQPQYNAGSMLRNSWSKQNEVLGCFFQYLILFCHFFFVVISIIHVFALDFLL